MIRALMGFGFLVLIVITVVGHAVPDPAFAAQVSADYARDFSVQYR